MPNVREIDSPRWSAATGSPPPLDAIERQYLTTLQAVRAYRFEGTRLVFLGAGGDGLVTLEREE